MLHTSDTISIYKLLDLNKKLFQFAPFPENAGKTRTDNNLVLGSKFETVDWKNVATELIKLQEPVEKLIADKDKIKVSDYLRTALKIHHRITQIHPFRDGNGRCSRALLNWMLRLNNLPPIYFKASEKNSYYDALKTADTDKNYNMLLKVTIKALFKTIMTIHKT